MTERPITFRAPMVRAILAGRKTQVRRIIKPQPDCADWVGQDNSDPARLWFWRGDRDESAEPWSPVPKCPYGQPGDRLWVRERWCVKFDDHSFVYNEQGNFDSLCICHRASDPVARNKDGTEKSPWKSPSHMPRWASRITLEITAVRVERLQDISELEALEEGVEPECRTCGQDCRVFAGCGYCRPSWRDSFAKKWDRINGAGSWAANPWVWAIEFQRVEPCQ